MGNPFSNGGATHEYAFHSTPVPSKAPRVKRPQGFAAWLPAALVLIAMPLLALAATKYVLLPSVKQAMAPGPTVPAQFDLTAETPNLVIAKIPLSSHGHAAVSPDFRSITLVSVDHSLKEVVSHNQVRLRAVAAQVLAGLTLNDLDRPGALDEVRTQLLAGVNQALGKTSVKEVYITVKSK